ncbi:MAG: IMP dehydrogenase [Sphingobacteriia bacterium]|jgi:IMP dehydrogenase|nr:IMP dehydrogenase [Sphingobacteriia bacterium]
MENHFAPGRLIHEGLTYDDVLLIPGFSETLPRDADTRTLLTPSIQLNIPILSAAMDTVTEYRMAIAMAQEGGMGILHKNMSAEAQAEQVRKVKRSESGLIQDPVTLTPHDSLASAGKIMSEYKVGGIPVIDEQRHLVGILTNRDLRFQNLDERTVASLMTPAPLVTVPQGTTMEEAEAVLKKHKIEKLPVVDSIGKLVGLITYRDILKIRDYPNACKDHLGRLRVGAAVGVTPDTLDRVTLLEKAGVDAIIVDTAHGHSKGVLDMIKQIRKQFPYLQLIGGNVATGEGTLALIEAGVDAVKVGVGPGSICTTRIIAGVGVPQLTAVMLAAEAAKPYGIPVIADGGIKHTGDIPKALAAGAACVMAGGLFAGTDESPGETIIYEGRKFKSYRGMGSIEAMKEGSKDRYFQDAEEDIHKLVPEGIVGRVAFKGSVSEVLYQLIGGLRASMGYCGAATLEKLKEARMIRITQAGLRESHPHDVQITQEAPNYSRN